MIDFLARAACAIACLGAAQAATITVTPLANSDTALATVEGGFVLEDIQAFRQRVVSQPKAIIAFQSDGGSVIAGIEIGKIIRLRNFATLVPDNSRCASACALAWLGGAVRFMGPEAQIGFHAAYVVRSGALVLLVGLPGFPQTLLLDNTLFTRSPHRRWQVAKAAQ